MPEKEQRTPEQFDAAAEAAREELEEMRSLKKMETGEDLNVIELGDWWRKWVSLAGHKRLGRLIMGVK